MRVLSHPSRRASGPPWASTSAGSTSIGWDFAGTPKVSLSNVTHDGDGVDDIAAEAMTREVPRPMDRRAPLRRRIASATAVGSVLLLIAGCAPTEIDVFVFGRAARRVHTVAEYLGDVYAEQSDFAGVELQLRRESEAEVPRARLWDDTEQHAAWGGNWITGIDQGSSETHIVADALITIAASSSDEFFGSESASVFLCVHYLGEFNSKRVSAVEGRCPDGVETKLPSFQRVTVDQLADYEVDE
ncbi:MULTISPECIES: hypothetical protein [unclassified Rathayibacter]|uniref:hypothetical protein n=1 Tax=unclassified Rathayibacter TaxID=2609250 RepID=UPI001FB1DAFA|nr:MULTISPECIES: hypothetical protein [unclassified Rathayibacter]MCJ1672594.1 hypothetical protein [Rathayibacter sp. VKM Ac-2929]MCJ1682072.1 hypothetical protein [Rathayibacter sp. VKM Ac-2928]MCJ1685983.1 hypothetical protein [Rathayibacter sp. VKM Ac-2927]